MSARDDDATMATQIDTAALSRLVGTRISTVRAEPVLTGGAHSRVYACSSDAGELVLRICEGRQGYYARYFLDRVCWEARVDHRWAVEAARKAGVPAPEILATDRSRRWVVMKRLPGLPIDARYETWQGCPYDEGEFGQVLARLHAVAPSGFGPIDDWGTALFGTWAAFLGEAARSAIQTCRDRAALPPTLCRQLESAWVPLLPEAEVGQPSLLHMESLGFSNIMYDPASRRITGLLDYEDCLGGDLLFELAWMRYYFEHEGDTQRFFDFGRFEDGYGSIVRDDRRMALYQPFPYLDKLRWIRPGGQRARGYVAKLGALLAELQGGV